MARALIGAAMLVGLFSHTAAAHADPEPSEDVVREAERASVDPIALQGALNSEETDAGRVLDPCIWLLRNAEVEGCIGTALMITRPEPPVSVSLAARVRLTYYVESGVTYSGGHTYAGSTACSWNFKIGQRFRFPDGEVFTCNDRGLLGSAGWLDLWRRPDLARKYGPYATVEVIP